MKRKKRVDFSHKWTLIKQFIKRDISSRYKGSYLGILWSFITPIMMLVVYTFVFSVIFNARWNQEVETSKMEFAIILFAGLIVFNIFSEITAKAPTLILSNVNYVKKVVFPLEILPIVTIGSALFHGAISVVILLIGVFIAYGSISWTVLLFPIVLIPMLLILLGLSWFLASLGVYIRDIGQVISVIIPTLMFLSPIFYPIESIPEELQFLYYFNPLSYVVEDIRNVLIFGEMPNWNWLFYETLIGLVVMYLGYKWFSKTRKGFADVI